MSAPAAGAVRLGSARSAEFLRFCVVGGVGFLVDAGVLLAVLRLGGAGPIVGQLLSFTVAVWTTFELNRRWAFRGHRGGGYWVAFGSYLGVQGLGFLCNFAFYTLLYLQLPKPFDAPLFCLAVASAAALFVNYAGASLLVFRTATGSCRPGSGEQPARDAGSPTVSNPERTTGRAG